MIENFQGYCVSLKQALAIISVFRDIEQICHFSCSHPFNDGPFSIIKEQLQPQIFLSLLYIFRTEGIVARRYHSYQL